MTMKKQKTVHRFAAVAAVLLTLCLVFMMPVSAAWTADTSWGSNYDSATEFTIADAGDLAQFANMVNGGKDFSGKTVKLTADIDLENQEWTPIGNGVCYGNSYNGVAFKGTFDGDGHTISGLKIVSVADVNTPVGLFGVVSGGTVKNLVLDTVSVNTNSMSAGAAIGLMVDEATADNIYVSGSLAASNDNGRNEGLGGVVGTITEKGTVTNCINTASVTATEFLTDGCAGGVVGKAYYNTDSGNTILIQNCINTGAVTGKYAAGGIVSFSTAEVINCINTGTVKAGTEAGGIIGEQTNSGVISGNSNSGEISNTTGSAGTAYGGIVGWIRYQANENYMTAYVTDVNDNTNTGLVNAPGCSLGSGGIVGNIYNQAVVSGNINTANVDGGTFASGIVGALQYSDDNKVIPATESGKNITVTNNAVSYNAVIKANTGAKCQDTYAYNNDATRFYVADNQDSVTSYTITSTNSKVSVSPASAVKGQIVIITVNAAEGDTLSSLSVGETTVKKVGNLYYFMMPGQKVDVSAEFENAATTAAPSFDETVTDTSASGSTEVSVTIDISDSAASDVTENSDGTMTVTITGTDAHLNIIVTPTESTEDNEISGTVTDVWVNYVQKDAESADNSITDIRYDLTLGLTNPATQLPKIVSTIDEEAVKAISSLGHTPLAMIQAVENVEEINADLEKVEKRAKITLTFIISANKLSEDKDDYLIGYHITDKGETKNVEEVVPNVVREDDKIIITLNGDSFSTWAIGISDEKVNNINSVVPETPDTETPIYTGGSAVDTGSGNYQYYPRDVPSNGIISFGTSKVVTGMELPAGSDGTVTLNIKPTFAMPENGFYAFEIDAPGYNLDAKINGGLSFQIPVADLEAAGWTAEDIVLFHGTVAEDGKITWEALPTNLVKNENGVAYYKAAINSCSPFYIGFVKDGSVVNTEVVDPVTPETPVTPDEPEVLPPVDEPETPEQPTESPAPILAVLAGLGAAAVLRRK